MRHVLLKSCYRCSSSLLLWLLLVVVPAINVVVVVAAVIFAVVFIMAVRSNVRFKFMVSLGSASLGWFRFGQVLCYCGYCLLLLL